MSIYDTLNTPQREGCLSHRRASSYSGRGRFRQDQSTDPQDRLSDRRERHKSMEHTGHYFYQ